MPPVTDERDAADADEADSAPSAERRLGTVVAGSYRIVRHIGSGGSSHVFEAEHSRLGKRFAVKVLRSEIHAGRRMAQRFRREARAIARSQGEHIVSVIDCGELDDGTPYLVTELLQGEDLRSLLSRERTLPARRAVQIVIEACRGLDEVHRAGLIHRDLKPENLFITRRSTGEDWCKVLDFGVVKMETSQSTAQGAIVGTVRYMAPEQLADAPSVGPATDVYALGAILHECLAGKPLHGGSSVQEVMYQVMNAPPAALAALRPELPAALTDAVERAVAKKPDERPQSALELAELLAEALPAHRASPARIDTPLESDPTPGLPQSRSRNVLWPMVLAALVGVGVGSLLSLRTTHGAAQTPTAPSHVEVARLAPPAPVPSPVASETAAPSAPTPIVPPRRPAPAPVARRAAPLEHSKPLGRFDDANPYGTVEPGAHE